MIWSLKELTELAWKRGDEMKKEGFDRSMNTRNRFNCNDSAFSVMKRWQTKFRSMSPALIRNISTRHCSFDDRLLYEVRQPDTNDREPVKSKVNR